MGTRELLVQSNKMLGVTWFIVPEVQVYFSGSLLFLCETFRHHLEFLK